MAHGSCAQGLRERYESHHKLRYTDESLMAAAKFSSQYISDRCADAFGVLGRHVARPRHRAWRAQRVTRRVRVSNVRGGSGTLMASVSALLCAAGSCLTRRLT